MQLTILKLLNIEIDPLLYVHYTYTAIIISQLVTVQLRFLFKQIFWELSSSLIINSWL